MTEFAADGWHSFFDFFRCGKSPGRQQLIVELDTNTKRVFDRCFNSVARRGNSRRVRPHSTSAQRGEAAKAAWINPTCEYAWGKLPHMRSVEVS